MLQSEDKTTTEEVPRETPAKYVSACGLWVGHWMSGCVRIDRPIAYLRNGRQVRNVCFTQDLRSGVVWELLVPHIPHPPLFLVQPSDSDVGRSRYKQEGFSHRIPLLDFSSKRCHDLVKWLMKWCDCLSYTYTIWGYALARWDKSVWSALVYFTNRIFSTLKFLRAYRCVCRRATLSVSHMISLTCGIPFRLFSNHCFLCTCLFSCAI